jgi:ssDNA-binding Zn-finger/Zn-ribbon topoisomerase 1
MSKETITTTCFLCGSESLCTETDHGNRKFYQCSNEDCGDYEISRTAMSRMKDAPVHKQQAMEQAHMYRGTVKIVEIIVGPDNQVVGQAIPRSHVR